MKLARYALVSVLLLVCALQSQTHTFPALDTNNTFTGLNSFTQNIIGNLNGNATTATTATTATSATTANNALLLQSASWASPLAIGSTTPNTAFFSGINNVLQANAYPGADAGVKIQAALTALGGYGIVDARGITDPTFNSFQSLTGFTCAQGQIVLLGRASYTVQSTIVVQDGCALIGVDASPNSGTILKAKAGLNANIIEAYSSAANPKGSTQWWHYGRIENIAFDGNKSSNASGNCIEVWQIGEVSVLRNLFINNAAESGIRLDGSLATGAGIENISVFHSASYGINVVQPLAGSGSGTLFIKGLSGDDNTGALIRINTSSASTTIAGLKAESNGSGGNDPVVLIDTVGNNDVVQILSGTVQSNSGTRNDLVKITGSSSANDPVLTITNLFATGYTNLINDTINTITVPLVDRVSSYVYSNTITSAWEINTPVTFDKAITVLSTAPVANLAAGPTTYTHAGAQLTGTHVVADICTLGTSCSVALTGAAVFTSSSSYQCAATDRTAAAAVKFLPSSGSAFALTGTGTDVLSYVCVGD